MLALAAKAGVRLWLCGHYHSNYVQTSSDGIEIVTTSSVGGVINWRHEPPVLACQAKFNFIECVNMPPVVCDAFHSGMRLVRVEDSAIRHVWTTLANVPDTFDQAFDSSFEAVDARPSLERILDVPSDATPLHITRGRTEPAAATSPEALPGVVARRRSLPAGASKC